jgi:hypothetical protein
VNRIMRTIGLSIFALTSGAVSVALLLPFSHAYADSAVPATALRAHPVAVVTPRPIPSAIRTPRVVEATAPVPVILPPVHSFDHIPTALEVAMNPFRYVGAGVHWTCLVDRVPEPTFADAKCGPQVPKYGTTPLTNDQLLNDPAATRASLAAGELSLHRAISAFRRRATVVLTGDVVDLDHNETIVIDGTVSRPLLGENGFGVQRYYPTIHIDRLIDKRLVSY